MKNAILTLMLLFFQVNLFSQTKFQTYQTLNKKLKTYKLKDSKVNYKYVFKEDEIANKKYVSFYEYCTIYDQCSTVYFFEPKNYLAVFVKKSEERIWIEIHCKENTISKQQIDSKTKRRFAAGSDSVINILLDMKTPKKERDKIKNTFIELLKFYEIKKIASN